MHDDQLNKLLHVAEADIAPPKVAPAALAARVRATAGRRRHRRTVLVAVAPLALLAPLALIAAIVLGRVSHETPVEITSHEVDAAFQERLLALEAEAQHHASRARALIAERASRLNLLEDNSLADDPLAELREHVDIVAYRMILEADGLQADMRPSETAIEIYQRVIRDFPNTYSAEVAQERLTAAGTEGVKS